MRETYLVFVKLSWKKKIERLQRLRCTSAMEESLARKDRSQKWSSPTRWTRGISTRKLLLRFVPKFANVDFQI